MPVAHQRFSLIRTAQRSRRQRPRSRMVSTQTRFSLYKESVRTFSAARSRIRSSRLEAIRPTTLLRTVGLQKTYTDRILEVPRALARPQQRRRPFSPVTPSPRAVFSLGEIESGKWSEVGYKGNSRTTYLTRSRSFRTSTLVLLRPRSRFS